MKQGLSIRAGVIVLLTLALLALIPLPVQALLQPSIYEWQTRLRYFLPLTARQAVEKELEGFTAQTSLEDLEAIVPRLPQLEDLPSLRLYLLVEANIKRERQVNAYHRLQRHYETAKKYCQQYLKGLDEQRHYNGRNKEPKSFAPECPRDIIHPEWQPALPLPTYDTTTSPARLEELRTLATDLQQKIEERWNDVNQEHLELKKNSTELYRTTLETSRDFNPVTCRPYENGRPDLVPFVVAPCR